MIFFCSSSEGGFRQADLQGLYKGKSAFLVGGAPSLKTQPYKLLESPGILCFGMNNVPALVRCQYMVCSDDPRCFDRMLLKDPTICKLMNVGYAPKPIRDGDSCKLQDCPNVLFFETDIPHDDSRLFIPSKKVSWKRNSLFLSISLMAYFGIRRIYLAGSDFGPADRGNPTDPDGQYSVGASLKEDELVWNNLLYKYEIQDLLKLKPVFADAGLEIVDTSAYSKLSTEWRTMPLDKAVEQCLADNEFPARHDNPKDLPHVSRLYPASLREQVVNSRYTVVDEKDSIYASADKASSVAGLATTTTTETPQQEDAPSANDKKAFELPRIV